MPNGRALGGHSHDYKRNGTSTLFAAFEVATGKVTAAHKKRRRRIEFLDFMNDIVAAWPDKAIHVVLDNLNTHKPRKRPLAQAASERGVPLHATRGSWLNQVEIWSRFYKISPCPTNPSPPSNSSENTSMPSLTPTTSTPNRSSGPSPKSTKNVSKRVSRINDSGY